MRGLSHSGCPSCHWCPLLWCWVREAATRRLSKIGEATSKKTIEWTQIGGGAANFQNCLQFCFLVSGDYKFWRAVRLRVLQNQGIFSFLEWTSHLLRVIWKMQMSKGLLSGNDNAAQYLQVYAWYAGIIGWKRKRPLKSFRWNVTDHTIKFD